MIPAEVAADATPGIYVEMALPVAHRRGPLRVPSRKVRSPFQPGKGLAGKNVDVPQLEGLAQALFVIANRDVFMCLRLGTAAARSIAIKRQKAVASRRT